MAKTVDRTTYIQTKQVVDFTSGEIKIEENVTNRKKGVEPPYVKLYLDCMLTFKELSKSLNPIIMELLKYMSYAGIEENNGGQIIYLNAELKRIVAEGAGVTVKRVEQAITDFVRTGVFRRIATGTYQVNAKLFGRGEWNNISNIRAMFDFANGEIAVDIEKFETSEN